MNLRIVGPAEREIADAQDYYLVASAQLSSDFRQSVSDAMIEILQHPTRWPRVTSRHRRYRLAKFPYGVIYEICPGEVRVVAVMHLNRRPNYWVGRT